MGRSESGETDLRALLAGLRPQLAAGEFVFCSMAGTYGDFAEFEPLAVFAEEEGLSLVVPLARALEAGFSCGQPMRCITLGVHSSLDAVGLTVAVATALADRDIPANVIAGYYHDHVFVPTARSEEALNVLTSLVS